MLCQLSFWNIVKVVYFDSKQSMVIYIYKTYFKYNQSCETYKFRLLVALNRCLIYDPTLTEGVKFYAICKFKNCYLAV